MDEEVSESEQINSFRYAAQGLYHALKEGRNFRIQAFFGAVVLFLAWVYHFDRFEWSILLITISLELTAELLNTVIELLVDLAAREKILPKAKIAKDVSAASVLVISVFAANGGLFTFIPHPC